VSISPAITHDGGSVDAVPSVQLSCSGTQGTVRSDANASSIVWARAASVIAPGLVSVETNQRRADRATRAANPSSIAEVLTAERLPPTGGEG